MVKQVERQHLPLPEEKRLPRLQGVLTAAQRRIDPQRIDQTVTGIVLRDAREELNETPPERFSEVALAIANDSERRQRIEGEIATTAHAKVATITAAIAREESYLLEQDKNRQVHERLDGNRFARSVLAKADAHLAELNKQRLPLTEPKEKVTKFEAEQPQEQQAPVVATSEPAVVEPVDTKETASAKSVRSKSSIAKLPDGAEVEASDRAIELLNILLKSYQPGTTVFIDRDELVSAMYGEVTRETAHAFNKLMNALQRNLSFVGSGWFIKEANAGGRSKTQYGIRPLAPVVAVSAPEVAIPQLAAPEEVVKPTITEEQKLRNLRISRGLEAPPGIDGEITLEEGDYDFSVPELIQRLVRESKWAEKNLPKNPFADFKVETFSDPNSKIPQEKKLRVIDPATGKVVSGDQILEIYAKSPYFAVFREQVAKSQQQLDLMENKDSFIVGASFEDIASLLVAASDLRSDQRLLTPAQTSEVYAALYSNARRTDNVLTMGVKGRTISDGFVVNSLNNKIESVFEYKLTLLGAERKGNSQNLLVSTERLKGQVRSVFAGDPTSFIFLLPSNATIVHEKECRDLAEFSNSYDFKQNLQVGFLSVPFDSITFAWFCKKNLGI